jgi:nucleotide-binding universal stress UspA family protein
MAIRTILALLNGANEDSHIMDASWAMAERQAAHLSCLRFGPDLPQLLDSSVLLPPESASRSAHEHFAKWCKHRSPFLAEQPIGTPHASLDPQLAIESDADAVAARMRLTDLVVMTRPHAWLEDTRASLHAVLFEAGRPVLLIPPGGAESVGDKILIAWNGSEQAARAVALSLPLLAQARAVHIFDRAERADLREGRGPAELVEHLTRHGIAATALPAAQEAGAIAEDLLEACRKQDSDLLVMGGYTHGRLREFLLGGVTRRVLAEATLPVLMVH